MKVFGQLEGGCFENLSSASPTPTPTGRVYADITAPTAALPKFYDGTGWKTLAFTTSSVTPVDPQNMVNSSITAAVAANAMQISLKQAGGSDPSSTSPVTFAFRSATAGTGTSTNVAVTAALSVTIASGATLGSTNGNPNWVYVYAINNAGTVELAYAGSKLFDEGTIQNTTAGSSSSSSKFVLYSTTARTGVAVRLIGRVKSTQATAGTWATTPSEISNYPFEQVVPNSSIYLSAGNGHGSGNTTVRRYTTTENSVGSDLTLTQSSTLGDSITVNVDGVYCIAVCDRKSSGGTSYGISVNGSALTTSMGSLTYAQGRRFSSSPTTATSEGMSRCLRLAAGDIIRCQTDGSCDSSSAFTSYLIVDRVL